MPSTDRPTLRQVESKAEDVLDALAAHAKKDQVSDADRQALNGARAELRNLVNSIDRVRRRAIPSPMLIFVAAVIVVATAGVAGWLSARTNETTVSTPYQLAGVNLAGADLTATILNGADLRAACLMGTTLIGTSLEGADLSDADLRGAQMGGAVLTSTKGTFVIDDDTVLPTGFDESSRTRRLRPGEQTACDP